MNPPSNRAKEKHPQRVARKLKVLYDRVDEHVEVARVRSDVTCQKGCTHCCYLSVAMTLPEAITIIDYLSKTNFVTWKWFFSQLEKISKQAGDLLDREMTREKWFAQQTPCVFLDEEKKECRIYEVRPIACRTHLSVDEPHKCGPDFPGDQDIRFLNMREFDNIIWDEGKRLMKMEKLPLGWGPMPATLIWAFEYWTKGKRYFTDRFKNTPLMNDEANFMAWIHLNRSSPEIKRLLELQGLTDAPDLEEDQDLPDPRQAEETSEASG